MCGEKVFCSFWIFMCGVSGGGEEAVNCYDEGVVVEEI